MGNKSFAILLFCKECLADVTWRLGCNKVCNELIDVFEALSVYDSSCFCLCKILTKRFIVSVYPNLLL